MKITRVIFDHHITTKIYIKHGLTPREVEEIAVLASTEQMRWSVTEEHGGKLQIISESHDGRTIFIALRPIDVEHGIWKCVTAFYPTKKGYKHE